MNKIPANPNSIENGLTDPTPELGPHGSLWRATIAWLKGWKPARATTTQTKE